MGTIREDGAVPEASVATKIDAETVTTRKICDKRVIAGPGQNVQRAPWTCSRPMGTMHR